MYKNNLIMGNNMKKILVLVLILCSVIVFAKPIPKENHSIQGVESEKIKNLEFIEKVYIDWTDHRYKVESIEFDSNEISEKRAERQIGVNLNGILLDLIVNTGLGLDYSMYDCINKMNSEKSDIENNAVQDFNNKLLDELLGNFTRNVTEPKNDKYKIIQTMDMNVNTFKYIKNYYMDKEYKKIDEYLNLKYKNVKYINDKVKIFGTIKEFDSEKQLNTDLDYVPYKLKKGKITGLIINIDKNQLKLTNSLCPKIRLSNGDIIYSPAIWLNDEDNRKLMFNEVSDFSYIEGDCKIDKEENPLIVNAINLYGKNGIYTDIVIDKRDAYLVQQYYFYLLENHLLNGHWINKKTVSENYKFIYVNNLTDTWNCKVHDYNIFLEPENIRKLGASSADINSHVNFWYETEFK